MTEQSNNQSLKKGRFFTGQKLFWSFLMVLAIAVIALVVSAYFALNRESPAAVVENKPMVENSVEEIALHSGHEGLPTFADAGKAGDVVFEEASAPNLDQLLADTHASAKLPKTAEVKPVNVAEVAPKKAEVIVEPINSQPVIRQEKLGEVKKAGSDKPKREIDNLF